MGDYAELIAAGITVVGGAMKGKSDSKQAKAQMAAEERLARRVINAQAAMDREKFHRERELWQKALAPYAGMSRAPSLAGLSQMNTPYTQFDPETGQPMGQQPVQPQTGM